jgi:hypothetical protein
VAAVSPTATTKHNATTAKSSSLESSSLSSYQTIVTKFINQRTLTGRTLTLSGTTPEDRALQWLVRSDPVHLVPTTTVSSEKNSVSNTRLLQRYALVTLWYTTTSVRRWQGKGWLSDADECTWEGTTGKDACHSTSRAIRTVWLPAQGLNCTREWGLLTTLASLDLEGNFLRGKLPSTIGRWTFLSLENNRLTGPLPSKMGRWTNVSRVGLFYNQLAGTIPASIANWGRSVDFFYLYGNRLTGTIPASIGQWKNVTSVAFHSNR